ncbi:hypothetical protein WMF38_50455 [Sorangium sp. So ce118]
MKQPALDPVSSPASSGGGPAAPGGDPSSAGGDPASGAAAANAGAPASGGIPAGGAAAANAGAPASAAPAAATLPPSSGAGAATVAPPGAGAATVAPPGAVAPASASGAAPEYAVHFFRNESTYTAILQAGGRARQLSSEPGAACDELVGALALTIAILLDSEATPATAPAAVAPAPVAPPPAPPPPPRPAPDWDVSAEIGAAGTVGMLDPLRPAVMGELSLRRRAWSAGLGAVWLPRQEIDITPGAASIGLVAGAARGCATITGELDGFRLSACAASLLGAVHGAGKGFAQDREASAPWFAVGGSAIAEGPLFGTRALGWSARATLLVPIARARFTVDRRSGSEAGAPVTTEAVLDPSPVGLLVGLGARVSIF